MNRTVVQLIDCVLSMIVLMYWTLLLQCVAVFSCVLVCPILARLSMSRVSIRVVRVL